jgi:diguanylate cyclase (GGDEF)-like protein
MSLGRWPEADILIHDERISRIHCFIVYDGEKVFIEDNDSRNGTFVDGDKIEITDGGLGTIIQVGRTLMKIELKSSTEVEYDLDLFQNATKDSLTDISNRRYFMGRAEDEVALAARRNLPISIVMLDLDHFKEINDTHGHQTGDFILENLARLIEDKARAEDLFGRYGGEEFILMPRGDVHLEGVGVFCERIRKAVEDYEFKYHDTRIPVTVSIGYAIADASELSNLHDLIRMADEALYRAKENGRNRVEQN